MIEAQKSLSHGLDNVHCMLVAQIMKVKMVRVPRCWQEAHDKTALALAQNSTADVLQKVAQRRQGYVAGESLSR